jgi:hypothetical protein
LLDDLGTDRLDVSRLDKRRVGVQVASSTLPGSWPVSGASGLPPAPSRTNSQSPPKSGGIWDAGNSREGSNWAPRSPVRETRPVLGQHRKSASIVSIAASDDGSTLGNSNSNSSVSVAGGRDRERESSRIRQDSVDSLSGLGSSGNVRGESGGALRSNPNVQLVQQEPGSGQVLDMSCEPAEDT